MTTTADDPDAQLPAPADDATPATTVAPDPRSYIEIRPSERRLDPYAVTQAMDQLLAFLRTHTSSGWLTRRLGKAAYPRVEWLLVADGRPDAAIRYLVTTEYVDLVEDLRGILRTCFPNAYEFDLVEWHPQFLLDDVPPPDPDAAIDPADRFGPTHPSITADSPYMAAVEYRGLPKRRRDWMTGLTRYTDLTGPDTADRAASPRVPLSTIVETMVEAGVPVVYQVVLRPEADWSANADLYIACMEAGDVTVGDKFWNFVFVPDPADYRVPHADRRRIERIADLDPTRTFVVSARAVAFTRDDPGRANEVVHRLSTALTHLSGPYHEIVPTVVTDDDRYDGRGSPPGTTVFEDVCTMHWYGPFYQSRMNYLPWWSRASRGIVAGVDEVPGFCLVDGAALTAAGRRALAARPTERSPLALPPPHQLARFAGPGMALGIPLTHDRRPHPEPFFLPPSDQDRHSIVVGPTGSGKSVLIDGAALTNVEATAGPEIILDLKGGGTAEEYCRAHYARYGTLDDVLYFDCTRVLPALSVLDIRPLLAAGVPREEARSRIAGHYEEMLATLMGHDRFYQAVEAPKAIRNHLRALFDPVNGTEAVSNTTLFHALARTQRYAAPPAVADDRLADYFASLLDRDRDVFNRIMGGALNRVETIATDGRLAPMFDHVPGEADPRFDFADVVNEKQVVIVDFGGMEDRAKRAITLALFSTLWRALQARSQAAHADETLPLVNLYLEEAGAIGDSALLDTLLSQGRSFGLSVTLGVQFLGQLASPDPDSQTYEEALNETATIIAGQVAQRDDLVHALATDTVPAAEVDRRLSRMPRGEWLVRPGTAFGAESVPPFLMASLPAPPGHPASEDPLDTVGQAAFIERFAEIQAATADRYGLTHEEPSVVEDANDTAEAERGDRDQLPRVDIAYPYSKRMPPTVDYDPEAHALLCLLCYNRYDPTADGMRRAIACHSSIDAVDRDDVPIGALSIKRSPAERAETALSDRQFMFAQAVYDAMQGRWDPLGYDLRRDSMLRLQEYVGIEPDEIQLLIDLGVLRKDTDHPHRLYSITPAGRDVLAEAYREGVDYGHGKGDLEESSPHIMGVQLAVGFLEREYVDDPDSSVVTAETYYDIEGNQRLDVVGLDTSGDIVLTVEVERVNHDVRRAVPEDYDKMAASQPNEALWVVMSHAEAHDILAALNDPLDGEPRVTKTYSRSTPAQEFRIDRPGMTGLYTVDQLRERLAIG